MREEAGVRVPMATDVGNGLRHGLAGGVVVDAGVEPAAEVGDDGAGTVLAQDDVTKALNYSNNHWDALTRFVADGRIPIDNNWAERAVKAVALGRNAYMFAGSDAAGKRSATFYSFVATCLQHDIDPYAWLAYVLPRIATTRKAELVDLLPMNWKPDREQRAAA